MLLLRSRRTLHIVGVGLVALACALPALAQDAPVPADTQAPAHIAFVDGTVILERDGETDDSPMSMPLLAGDRVRTKSGRVEILFADGSTLHLDHHSVVDLQSDELVRLIEGRIRLSIPATSRAVSYRVDAPYGWAHITEPGDYRIALMHNGGGGELELAVIRGRAELVNEGGQTALRAGERAFVRAGAAPSYAYVANSAALDAFDRWSEGRRDARLAASAEYLPDEVQPYAASFDQYGYWRDEPTYGRVWYPRVSVDWRPYYYGRWVSLRPYGWTWIAHDPWGWPTHHYGRWGISASGSWFWIPGRRWGAAWVSWAYAPGYVSWCPLGWNNRPIFQINVVNVRSYNPWRAWTIVPRGHFGRGFVHRNVVRVSHIDHRTLSAFTHRDRAPESLGRAVPRASSPIRAAGTAAGRRGTAPLYTNVPADRGRIRTNGARIRVPDAAPAGRSSSGVQRAVPRERAVPTAPAVRSNRPAESSTRAIPGARPGAVNRGGAPVRSEPRTGVRRSEPPTGRGTMSTPGARRRVDAPRSIAPSDAVRSPRPGAAVPRSQPPPDRGRTVVPGRQGDTSVAPRRIESPRPSPGARRPGEVPRARAPYRSEAPRSSPSARPSSGARPSSPRAVRRSEPARPSSPSRAPQMERRGPDRAPSGSIQRRGPAPSQPSARPGGGGGSRPSARPGGGSGSRPSARPRGGGRGSAPSPSARSSSGSSGGGRPSAPAGARPRPRGGGGH